MRTIWHSLAWKEWHEHKWKLVALVAILCGLSVATLFGDDGREALPALWLICLLPAAIFLGLEAAAGESSRGTLAFLQALPVPLWRVALAKLMAGLGAITIATCLAVGMVYLAFLFGGRVSEVSEGVIQWPIYIPLFVITASASLFLWSAATGVGRPDEISAGAVALACILGCWLLLIAVNMAIVYTFHAEAPLWLRAFGLSIAPAGFIALFVHPPMPIGFHQVFGCIVAGMVHLALAVWFTNRFGRGVKETLPSLPVATVEHAGYFARRPMRSQVTAIMWKQARESLPIVLAGLGGAVAIVTIAMAVAVLQDAAGVRTNYAEWFGHILLMASIIFGIMVAVVAGMGAYLFDLGDRLGAFWRSRPISVDVWFWTKFFTGLVIVIVVFQLPMSVGYLMDRPSNEPGVRQSLAVLWQITAYSTAAAGICLVRRPMYAVVLGLATLYVAWVAFAIVLGYLFNIDLEPNVPHWLTWIGLGLYSLAASLVAWLAVRYEWGNRLDQRTLLA